MRGRAVGKRTLSRTRGRKRIGRRDGEGSLLAMRPVHAGEGGRGKRGVCWRGDLSMRGRARVRKGESAGGETCPCGGEGSLLAMRPVHAGEGERGERSLLAVRSVHAGEGGRGERESAGGETCPCGGGRVWGEGSLLAKRPVHAGEGGRGGRGSLLVVRLVHAGDGAGGVK